jgi:citrate synthase
MKGPAGLAEHQDRIATRMGGWFPGKRVVFRGRDLHVDLKDLDWIELYVYGITGRRYSAEEIRILHALWMKTSYPDPRLWNNRVAAVAGSARSTGNLAISAALAVSEASIYGRRPDIRAIDFLLRTKARVDQGSPLPDLLAEEMARRRAVYGYGRPIIGTDERIPHMMALVTDLGLDGRPYVRLAFEVERTLREGRWRMHMNFAGLAAALVADMGFSRRDFYLFAIPAFVAGMVPCFIDASEKPEGTFLPLPCDRIDYRGAQRRSWI